MEGDDFEFIPPAEILSITEDTWWNNYTNAPERYFVVKHKCPKGLIYITQTWAKDEIDAYQRVMTGNPVHTEMVEEQTND